MLSLECGVLREGGPIPPGISPHSPVALWLLDLCLCLWVWVMFASSCLSQVHGTRVIGGPLNTCRFELNYKIFFLSSFKPQTHPKDHSKHKGGAEARAHRGRRRWSLGGWFWCFHDSYKS